jgi:hypothetical protein
MGEFIDTEKGLGNYRGVRAQGLMSDPQEVLQGARDHLSQSCVSICPERYPRRAQKGPIRFRSQAPPRTIERDRGFLY